LTQKNFSVAVICDDSTGEPLRYSVTSGDVGDVKHDVECETTKLVQEGLTLNQAKGLKIKLDKALAKFSPSELARNAHNYESFDQRLPEDPRARAAAFRSLDESLQEQIVCAAICATGLPIKKIAAWLCVPLKELSHIQDDVLEAARTELDLRIAKRMIDFAMQSKAPAAMSATIYLTKALLKWNEGPEQAAANAAALDINLKVTQNTNEEVNALRVELDDIVKAADAKAAARLQ
jgi:hypothetical protein